MSADPRSLVLSSADLPGWEADASSTKPISNPRDITGDSSNPSPFTDNGWVRGYEADFVSSSASGPRSVFVLVSVFRNPAGTSAFFMQGIGGQDLPTGTQALADPPSFGERSKVYRQQVSDNNEILWYWFYWQDRNVFVRVLVKGPATAEREAVTFAQREAQIVREH